MTEERSPRLEEVIAFAIDHRLSGLHVAMVGRVVSYDATKREAQVEPVMQNRNDASGTVQALPILPSVPVVFPGGGGCEFTWPLSAGDFVHLVFGDQEQDTWRQVGGAGVTPQLHRRHAISDAVAYPVMLRPDPVPAAHAADVVIKLGQREIHITPEGMILLGATAIDAPALASKVTAELARFIPALSALAADLTALGSSVGIGATSAAAIGALLGGSIPSASVASAYVRSD